MFKKFLASLLALAACAAFAAVDVNSATEADLDSIKGIGPGTSAKILEARKTAKFKDWGDLMERTSGIGAKRAVKLSNEGLTVNGEAFIAGGVAATDDSAKKKSKPVAKAPASPAVPSAR